VKTDAVYYSELAIGAEYLASKASCATERAEHLRMSRLYRLRAEDAAPQASATIH
jgi:hypothetical protein